MNDNTIKPKKYDFSLIEGISKKQLDQHYKLYEGYVNNLNKILQILQEKSTLTTGTTYSEARSLALGETYALNGTKLHELYFENLGDSKNQPSGLVLNWIQRDYDSFEQWQKRFTEYALSVRGWVIFTFDPIDMKTHIIGQDAHDVGSIWCSAPLLVLDVYEHAYMIQFGIDRKAYIDVFFNNIDWDIVNQRAAEAMFTYLMLTHGNE